MRMEAKKMRTFAFNKADDIKELMSDFDFYASTGKPKINHNMHGVAIADHLKEEEVMPRHYEI